MPTKPNHWMFWLVSGKGGRRPFYPDDEWAVLTGHFSLTPSFSLFIFSIVLPPFCLSTTPPQPEATICFLLQWPGDGFHLVTDLVALARGKTPQTFSNTKRPTTRETRLKLHLYLLGSQNSSAPIYLSYRSLHFSGNYFSVHLESLFLFFQTYLDFFHDVSSLLDNMSHMCKIPLTPIIVTLANVHSHSHISVSRLHIYNDNGSQV